MCRDRPAKCLIALGGNIGPVEQNFALALDRLADAECHVLARSRCHQSAPMGSNAGATFVNAAALIETALSPLQLLDLLQEVENAFGRVRSVHWGARALDLDLLFYGQQVIESERLTVPHPGLWYRRFVLEPLVEIAPKWKHPISGHTVEQLSARLTERPLVIEVRGMDSLPMIPDRYVEGTVEIRSAAVDPAGTVSSQGAFFRLYVTHPDEPVVKAIAPAANGFELVAARQDVDSLLDAVLVAALGH